MSRDAASFEDEREIRFEPLDIVRQAVSNLRSEWAFYLKWGWQPLAAFVAGFALYVLGNASGVFVFVLSAWLAVPFSVAVYRRVLLGEVSTGSPVTNLFAGRTWNYIGNGILMHVLRFLVSVLLGIAPVAIGAWLVMKTDPQTQAVLERFFDKDTLREMISFLGFLVLAEQYVLIWPDVAVDGPTSFSRLKKKAGWARAGVIKVMALIWSVPLVLQYCLQAVAAAELPLGWWTILAGWGVVLALYALAMVLSTVSGAILYARLILPGAAGEGVLVGGK